jgi:DNA polymerase I-like protein with 3'-5' exonuclease and polymerase domains
MREAMIAYGMSYNRLFDELNGQGFTCTREEAKKLFYKYCDTYKTAVDFLRSSGKEAASQGYLVNLNGRRRYWIKPDQDNPDYYGRMAGIEREGGNFLIQSVNADITKDAMIGIRNYRKQHNIRTHFINAVYDEVVTRTHKDDSAEFHKAKLAIMVASAEKWIKDVPMIVDGHAGKCWQK